MRNVVVLLLASALCAGAAAQGNSAANSNQSSAVAPLASIHAGPALNASTIAQLNKVVENTRVDVAGLRIDKWKTDSNIKRQAQSNAESLQRNMTSALPVIVGEVRANPNSVAAAFKLYRNVNALYEVMASLTESAGAFGPKDEYRSIAADTQNLDDVRRTMGEEVQFLANARDQQVASLEARARQAAQTAAPPKKIIVDESQPAKKLTKKRSKPKPTTSTSASESEGQNPPK